MLLLTSVLVALFVTFILLPIIIKMAESINLVDTPDRRKIHHASIPSLGGIGIFGGFILAISIALPLTTVGELKFFLVGIVITFLLGVRDDIASLQAKHKVSVQLLCAFLVVYFSGIKLEGLYGILGIYDLPYGLSEVLSIFVIMALTNSYNLIDGIDGLAGSVALIVLTLFGWIFFQVDQLALATICLSFSGALIAFLFFNWFPAKIFMGDTGSMMLGFVLSVMSILVINKSQGLVLLEVVRIDASVGLVIGALILPIYDTFRVIIIRVSQGISPFFPDRNHIHHALLKLGLNHAKATTALLLLNVLSISLSIALNNVLNNGALILLNGLIVVVFGICIDVLGKKKHFMSLSRETEVNPLFVSKSA